MTEAYHSIIYSKVLITKGVHMDLQFRTLFTVEMIGFIALQ
jgi:hypothetical protein